MKWHNLHEITSRQAWISLFSYVCMYRIFIQVILFFFFSSSFCRSQLKFIASFCIAFENRFSPINFNHKGFYYFVFLSFSFVFDSNFAVVVNIVSEICWFFFGFDGTFHLAAKWLYIAILLQHNNYCVTLQ